MRKILILLFALALTACASAPPAADTPRVAIVSAFAPELALLLSKVEQPQQQTIKIAADNSARVLLAFLAAWK
jgi:starvation-inducible outer membrane lipoprotein